MASSANETRGCPPPTHLQPSILMYKHLVAARFDVPFPGLSTEAVQELLSSPTPSAHSAVYLPPLCIPQLLSWLKPDSLRARLPCAERQGVEFVGVYRQSSQISQPSSQMQQQRSVAQRPFKQPPPPPELFWGACCWYCIGGGCW